MSGLFTAIVHAGRALGITALFLTRHPSSLLLAYALTVVIAVPFTSAMTREIAVTDGYPAALGRGALAVDWWVQLRQHDVALAVELLPRRLGFAAPLDTLSEMLTGPMSHTVGVVAGTITYALAWALLWAAVLSRLAQTREPGAAAAWHAARRLAAPLLSITVAAGVVAAVLYFTIHPLLMKWLWPRVAAGVEAPAAFLLQVAFYAVFGVLLVVLSAVADVARAHVVLTGERALPRTIAATWGAMSRSPGAVVVACLTLLAVHLTLLAAYGVAEIVGGARLGGWRAVAAAQLYVLARLMLRLIWGGSLLLIARDHLRAAPR